MRFHSQQDDYWTGVMLLVIMLCIRPFALGTSVARWFRLISTDKRVEEAPFTVILALLNVVEGCNKSYNICNKITYQPQGPIFLAILGNKLLRYTRWTCFSQNYN